MSEEKKELKRGKYSKAEVDYMIHNSHRPVEEVAEYINRSPEAVTEFWKSKGLYIEKTAENKAEENRLCAWLHSLSYWPSILSSFSDDEIAYYEQNWMAFIKQFNEDVSYSEHIYIKDWLVLELEKKRTLQRERDSIEAIEELKKKKIEIENSKDILDERDMMAISNIASELGTREGIIIQSVRALKELNADIKHISDKLKADRQNRREKQTDVNTIWKLIEKIDSDEDFRKQEIYKAELYKASTDKAQNDLYQLHTFIDKSLDRCILNSESVMLDEE